MTLSVLIPNKRAITSSGCSIKSKVENTILEGKTLNRHRSLTPSTKRPISNCPTRRRNILAPTADKDPSPQMPLYTPTLEAASNTERRTLYETRSQEGEEKIMKISISGSREWSECRAPKSQSSLRSQPSRSLIMRTNNSKSSKRTAKIDSRGASPSL